jgi:hypothetical protein
MNVHCLGYPRHQRPQFEGLFVHEWNISAIPEVYLGKENIGSQLGFVVDDRKDEGDYFDGVLGARGPQFWKIAFDFQYRKFCWER